MISLAFLLMFIYPLFSNVTPITLRCKYLQFYVVVAAITVGLLRVTVGTSIVYYLRVSILYDE